MFGDEFAIDLKTWKKVLYASLGGGNKITSARLHALQMMIDQERGRYSWEGQESEKLVLMDTLSNLCQFAKTNGSAKEKTIFIHIMIDLVYDYEKRHTEPPPRRLTQSIPYDSYQEMLSKEDSSEYLIPPADRLSTNGNLPL